MSGHIVRSTVKKKSSYSLYKQELRRDFLYACAYCTSNEREARCSFEIDHYLAKSRRPDLENEYTNLNWSCRNCNKAKDNRGAIDETAVHSDGPRFFHPEFDDWAENFELEDDGIRLRPTSTVGEYTDNFLHMNRAQLIRIRTNRRNISRDNKYVVKGLAELLAYPIDRLPRKVRGDFVRIRKELLDKHEECLDAIARYFQANTDLDVDSPDTKEKQAYRKNIRSIEKLAAPSTSPKKKKKKSRRRKNK